MGKRRSRKKLKSLAKAWCHRNTVVFTDIIAPPVVSVGVKLKYAGQVYVGYGGARCCRLDEFNESRGRTIATGRAATAIAVQLMELGETPWKYA